MWILYLIGIYIVGSLIVSFVKSIIEKHQQKVRNQVANDFFQNTDIESKIEISNKKLSHIVFDKKIDPPTRIPSWEYSRLPKYAQKITNSICPSCGEGYLKVGYIRNRFGTAPSSFYCNKKPQCDYKISFKKAKEQFETEHTESFKTDFNQAYS